MRRMSWEQFEGMNYVDDLEECYRQVFVTLARNGMTPIENFRLSTRHRGENRCAETRRFTAALERWLQSQRKGTKWGARKTPLYKNEKWYSTPGLELHVVGPVQKLEPQPVEGIEMVP